MRLVLFHTASGLYLVSDQVSSKPGQEIAPKSTWQRIKTNVQRVYRQLQDRFDHLERVCGSLRHADRLTVIHSARLDSREVEKKLRKLWQSSYRKHRQWMVFDAVVAGLGAILTPIPGPNVFFFYPAARSLSHYFAKKGAKRALELEISLQPESLIETVELHWSELDQIEAVLEEIEDIYGLSDLQSQLSKIKTT